MMRQTIHTRIMKWLSCPVKEIHTAKLAATYSVGEESFFHVKISTAIPVLLCEDEYDKI